MLTRFLLAIVLCSMSAVVAFAQNSNSSTTVRPRTTSTPSNTNSSAPAEPQRSTDIQKPATTQPAARATPATPRVTTAETPGSQGVVAAFNASDKRNTQS